MKILYFHQHFTTPEGSWGTRSYEMAQALLADGHEVTMVCGSSANGVSGLLGDYQGGRRTGLVDGLEVVEFDLGYSNAIGFIGRTLIFLKFALRSVWLAMTTEYDIVFATSTPLTAGIPGICARWLRRKRFVFEVRDLWPELPRAMGVITNPLIVALMSILEWVSYHSAHQLIGLSPGIVEGIQRRGIARERILLVPNGCDLRIFARDHDNWRPPEVADADFLAVYSGTHGPANGLDAVLDAAQVLKQRHRSDIKLLLIGDGKLKSALQDQAREQQLSNLVFADPVSKYQLAKLFAHADLGLQILANVPAFYFGTSPNKFFDYIAAGLPVLTNYPGWLAEMIRAEPCGFAVPPGDAEAFVDALERAADDRPLLAAMGAGAVSLAGREFSRDRLAKRFVEWVVDGRSMSEKKDQQRMSSIEKRGGSE